MKELLLVRLTVTCWTTLVSYVRCPASVTVLSLRLSFPGSFLLRCHSCSAVFLRYRNTDPLFVVFFFVIQTVMSSQRDILFWYFLYLTGVDQLSPCRALPPRHIEKVAVHILSRIRQKAHIAPVSCFQSKLL